MYAKYQLVLTAKALLQVEFPVYALHVYTPYEEEKMAKFKMLSFCQNIIFLVY